MTTPTISLDKTREHSTVHPPENDAHYFQDGFYFTVHGKLIESMMGAADTKRLERIIKLRVAEQAAAEAYAEALGSGATLQPVNPNAPVPTESAVDLAAWAKDEIKYPFFKVSAAVSDKLSITPTNARAAKIAIVQAGYATAEQAGLTAEDVAA